MANFEPYFGDGEDEIGLCGGNRSLLEEGIMAACALNDAILDTRTGLDTFFLIFAGALVFMMQAGFAMLCAGSVRQKNVKNIMLKNILDACGGALGFFSVGFGVAYGGNQSGLTFVGDAHFGLRNFAVPADGKDESFAFFFFQFAFAATAATIVAGTVAERCKMAAYLCYSVFLTAWVYLVVAHSVWDDNGFLSAFADEDDRLFDVGMIDFAGSGVVHMTGGLTALIAAIILGPRIGRFYDDDGNPLDEPVNFPPHSVALQVLGTFILWFGWYGFNPGSALAINSAGYASVAALCAVTTTMAAASGCVVSMFTDSILEAMSTGETTYDLTMAMNGALGGLVAITAGTSVVAPWAAIVIGAIGGWVYLGFSKLLVRLKIDDAVDAIPVHFANGLWGCLAVGLFAKADFMEAAGYVIDGRDPHEGLFYEWESGGSSARLLAAQICGLLFIIGWVSALMTPFFIALKYLGMFRVDELEEEVGLDISHHRGAAYDFSGAKKEDVDELVEVRASRHGKIEVPKAEDGAKDDAAQEEAED